MTAPRFPMLVQTLGGVARQFARTRALTLEPTGNETVDRVLRLLVDQLAPLVADPRADATVVRDVTFTASVTATISHRLGRAYAGWSVVRVRGAGSTFYEQTNPTAALNATQLLIVPSGNCTADVEVW